MKIEYDFENKYFKIINNLLGIFFMKKSLMKNPNRKIRSFLSILLFSIILFILLFIIIICLLGNLGYLDDNLIGIFSEILSFGIFAFLVFFFYFFVVYFYVKKYFGAGTLEIKKNGISDQYNNGMQMFVPYDIIDLVVITNDVIVFFTDTHAIYIVNDGADTELLTKKINDYSNILIIDKCK